MKKWLGPVAVLYPAQQNGHRVLKQPAHAVESGADMAYALRERDVPVITPQSDPDPAVAVHWCFADSEEGIDHALSQGARILMPNMPMDSTHPLATRMEEGFAIAGHMPVLIDPLESKALAHNVVQHGGMVMPLGTSAASAAVVSQFDIYSAPYGMEFPLVVKPVRGYGRRFVTVVHNREELLAAVGAWQSDEAGDDVMIQSYLPGDEISVVVLPPGDYWVSGKMVTREHYWTLPLMRWQGHVNGVIPPALGVQEGTALCALDEKTREAAGDAVKLAELVQSRTLFTVDFRQDASGIYRIFDANFIPDLSGGNRPGRSGNPGLPAVAASAFGWDYPEFVENLARQWWTFEE